MKIINRTIFQLTVIAAGIVLIPDCSVCQKNYLPGYIIKNNGDTLHGFIDYRNWEKNPGHVSFKTTMEEEKTEVTPVRIIGFRVADEFYERAVVQTEISPEDIKSLQHSPEIQLETDTAFLQTMITGAKSLYFYQNKIGKKQFYIRKDSFFELLIFKSYLKDQDQRTVIAKNNKYIGQLLIYLNDCPEIRQKINKTEYDKTSLEDLFIYYYKFSGSEIRFQKKTEKVITQFGILAGPTVTTLKFSGSGHDYLVKTDYDPAWFFTAAAWLEVIIARNQGKWSVCSELSFTSYKFTGQYNDYIHEEKYTIYSTTLGYSYLKLNVLPRFRYPIGKMFLFINGGVSFGYAIAEKNELTKETRLYTMDRFEESEALPEVRRFEVGFPVGLGVKLGKFSCEFRYEWGNGISDNVSLKSVTNRYSLIFGYRII